MCKLAMQNALAKLDRGNLHAQKLNETLSRYIKDQGIALVKWGHPEGDTGKVGIHCFNDMPSQVPFQLGDAIHNFRASLDIAVFALAEGRAKNPTRVYFPFADNVIKLRQRLKISGLKGLSLIESLEAFILDHKNQLVLKGLSELDNIDKHRSIIPIAQVASLKGDEWKNVDPCLSFLGGAGYLRLTTTGTFAWGPRILELDQPSSFCVPPKITRNQPSFEFVFPNYGPFGGQELNSKLQEIQETCYSCIQILNKIYESNTR